MLVSLDILLQIKKSGNIPDFFEHLEINNAISTITFQAILKYAFL